MGDIIHQGGQYSLVNNVRGDNFGGGGEIFTITPAVSSIQALCTLFSGRV